MCFENSTFGVIMSWLVGSGQYCSCDRWVGSEFLRVGSQKMDEWTSHLYSICILFGCVSLCMCDLCLAPFSVNCAVSFPCALHAWPTSTYNKTEHTGIYIPVFAISIIHVNKITQIKLGKQNPRPQC